MPSKMFLQMATYNIFYFLYLAVVVVLYVAAITKHISSKAIFFAIALAWLPIVVRAFQELGKKRISTEFFISIATIVGLAAGQEKAIMLILLIMLIAHYLELLIKKRTEDAITSLVQLIPTHVMIMEGDQEREVPIGDVKPGMFIAVKAGGRIPVDGVVVQGHATVNEATLTGESLPKEKDIGSQVYAETFLESGTLIIKTELVQQDTLFGHMIKLLSQAEKKKAAITTWTDRIAFVFTPLMLILIIGTWLITKNSNLVITLLIFGSPLELALVTPLAILAGTVAAFKQGILVKGGQALERCAYVDTLIFDKTGTLTWGKPQVVEVIVHDKSLREEDIIKLAAIAEKYSEHVLARAILQKAKDMGIVIPNPESYGSVIGHGVTMTYENKRYFLGNKHFIEANEHGATQIPPFAQSCSGQQIQSSFFLASDKRLLGTICIADKLRPDAQTALDMLKKSGLTNLILLSGDKQEVTQAIAHELGITQAFGEALPEKKVALLDTLRLAGHKVAMVGDGINDAPALKEAYVGIAMGAMGMEPAIDAADIVLMTHELKKIVFIRQLAQKVLIIIKQNLIVGFVIFHTVGVVLALASLVTPMQAAFFHAISDILILLNATRLINVSPRGG